MMLSSHKGFNYVSVGLNYAYYSLSIKHLHLNQLIAPFRSELSSFVYSRPLMEEPERPHRPKQEREAKTETVDRTNRLQISLCDPPPPCLHIPA